MNELRRYVNMMWSINVENISSRWNNFSLGPHFWASLWVFPKTRRSPRKKRRSQDWSEDLKIWDTCGSPVIKRLWFFLGTKAMGRALTIAVTSAIRVTRSSWVNCALPSAANMASSRRQSPFAVPMLLQSVRRVAGWIATHNLACERISPLYADPVLSVHYLAPPLPK